MGQLRYYQREDVNAIKKAKLLALIASAPGTGKSAVTIRALAETWPLSLPALILCPASVTENWGIEINMWAPGIRPVIIDDMASEIPQLPPPVIYITSWALLDARSEELSKLGIKTVVGDEFHYVRNPDTLRTQALNRIIKDAPHRIGLTGTPIVNDAQELDIIKSFLGPNPLMIRRLLEEAVPDVPPKTRNYLKVRLRPRHQAIYDKALNDFEDWLRTGKESLRGQGKTEDEIERILAVEGLVKIGYLRRLVGEFKVPAALDWVARAVRLGEPVVVFLEHQAPLLKLQKGLRKLNIGYTTIEGANTSKERQKAIEDFQTGNVPVFIGTKAAKEGITLTYARNVLFIERFYTAADEEQAEDRARRIGQKFPTTMWYLHAENSVDDRLDAIVRNKRAIVKEVLGSPDIIEREDSNIRQILATWERAVDPPKGANVMTLGESNPLPPLPSKAKVHSIVFTGLRWNQLSAMQWCRMNGYKFIRVEVLPERVRVIISEASEFKQGSYEKIRVSSEISIYRGERSKQGKKKRKTT